MLFVGWTDFGFGIFISVIYHISSIHLVFFSFCFGQMDGIVLAIRMNKARNFFYLHQLSVFCLCLNWNRQWCFWSWQPIFYDSVFISCVFFLRWKTVEMEWLIKSKYSTVVVSSSSSSAAAEWNSFIFACFFLREISSKNFETRYSSQ